MGCGQSKIGIYQRKSKNKKNGSKRSVENGEKDGETEDGEDTISADTKDPASVEKEEEETESVTLKLKQMAQQQTGGAVLAQSDISSSQLDFFKMLDEKIENGPDYEESDEEEQKARMANLLEEWKNACIARQQKKAEETEQEKGTFSPGRGPKLIYQDEYTSYPGKRMNLMTTQRFPAAYSVVPVNSIHMQNSYKMNPPPYVEQSRLQPRIPIVGNYHPYHPASDSYNHCEASMLSSHPTSSTDPINPLRPQILLRQSSISSQVQHYPENQRLYPESIRQFPDFSRPYHDQRSYQISRNLPTANVLYEHRMGSYGPDMSVRPQQTYQEDPRQTEEVQRMIIDLPRQYSDPQRPVFGNVDDQRIYHERLQEKPRQYSDGTRPLEGPKAPMSFQKPPLLAQRSIPEPPTRVYRDFENDESCFSRQERFTTGDSTQEGPAYRSYNSSHFKGGRSLSVELHYLAGPPPPREMIPLQGAPGPPQGSPRPLVARGLQPNMHRLPANSVVHFRKPQGAFT